jgi:hypothetical protein
MPKEIVGRTQIKTVQDAASLPYSSERAFAQAALQANPDLIIIYEGVLFRDNSGEKDEAHLPDFHVRNPRNFNGVAEKGIYVEVTEERKKSSSKKRQARVMEKAAPDERYVQLRRKHIKRLARSAKEKTGRRKIVLDNKTSPFQPIDMQEGVFVTL